MSKKYLKRLHRQYQAAGAIFFFIVLMAIIITGLFTNTMKVESAKAVGVKETAYIVGISPTMASEQKTATTGTGLDFKKTEQEAKKQYYNIPLPKELQDYIFDVSEKYGVPCEVIIAVIEKESRYDADAVGSLGEQGYMQINPCNNEWLSEKLGVSDFFDPEQNINCGAYMLSLFFNKYDTVNEALMCYNCGEYGASRLWEKGITETSYCTAINEIIKGLVKEG